MASHLAEYWLTYALAAVGLIVLARFWQRGWLNRHALVHGPDRTATLNWPDLAVGVGLMVLGMLLVGAIAPLALDWLRELGIQQAVRIALLGLVGQLVYHLPVAGYFTWRASWVEAGLWKLGILTRNWRRDARLGAIGFAAAIPLVMGLVGGIALVIGLMLGLPAPDITHPVLEEMLAAESLLVLALLILSAVIVAPVLEELIFRGLFQTALLNALGGRARWTAVLIASALFALVHAGVEWQAYPMLFALGVIMGWLYERTGSLWPAIFVHAGFNAFNIALVFLLFG